LKEPQLSQSNDFSDSPSGLDPKDQKPWAELSEVERLEYHALIKRRMNNRIQEIRYQRSLAEETRQDTAQSIAIGLLFTFTVFLILTAIIQG
jgi:hypothetical protein